MFVIEQVIMSMIQVISIVFQLYTYVIIGRALISWVNPDPDNPIVQFLYRATEPPLALIKRYIPCVFGGIDFSIIILIVGLQLARNIIVQILVQIMQSI